MTLHGSLFYLLAGVIVFATAMTVTSRNLVHAVVCLVISFLGTAVLFYLLGAPLIAALEVIIYAGAIMVLFLMVIMLMADAGEKESFPRVRRLLLPGGMGGIAFGLVLFFVTVDPGRLVDLKTVVVPPSEFGHFVFTRYWLAVEIASFLLFVALAGAYYLGRERLDTETREETV